MAVANDPQTRAADPRTSSWVSANAGSGKTSTLVRRVARLLLGGTSPERILCVTFTKAAAAEMQRRVFDELGGWAVMESDALRGELAKIDEADVELAKARRLFARALETPGGLQIETIHAFCGERLLRRFPLEAGVSPGFRVIDDVEKSVMVREARALLADIALARPNSEVGRAYAHFSVALHFEGFEQLLASFETRRREIVHFALADGTTRVWRRCGFDRPGAASAVEATVMGGIRWKRWSWAMKRAEPASGQTSHRNLAATMGAISPESRFDDLANVFFTANGLGEARKGFGAASLEPDVRAWLGEEQQRVGEARERVLSARVAEETCHALSLARAYAGLYEGAKDERGGLDFDDLIERSRQLLTERADAAWVLYKLDGGIDHLLLDEAQDTSPDQWLILRALVEGFFADAGAGTIERTIFAVADEKQSIFSFQGAAPERFAIEYERYRALIDARGSRLATVPLHTSFRSTPEILAFVDRVFADEAAAAGLRPSGATIAAVPLAHVPKRPAGGSVELWPLEVGGKAEEVDVWAPVDAEPAESKNKRLARRIARTIKAIVDRGEAVAGRDETPRPCAWSDFLILVRRRNALFHEIIRALKAQGVPVGGADRLPLSEHGVFGDLVALAWFVLYPGDELSLAGLLRGPFCDLGEEDLFDLAYERDGSLWATLRRRAPERAAWRSAADFLRWAIQAGRTMAPFDFYGAVLARLDGEGRSMRQRLLTRLSAEGEDALDAFMAEVLAAEERGARDLESFAAAMAVSDIEVKREQDEAYSRPGGEVRVMSVHGQGAGGADRDSARHLDPRPAARRQPHRRSGGRAPVAAEEGRGLPGIPGSEGSPQGGGRARILAPALRRPHQGARPAYRLRRRGAAPPLRGQLVRLRRARLRRGRRGAFRAGGRRRRTPSGRHARHTAGRPGG